MLRVSYEGGAGAELLTGLYGKIIHQRPHVVK
jgi:hypothetical protein